MATISFHCPFVCVIFSLNFSNFIHALIALVVGHEKHIKIPQLFKYLLKWKRMT